MNKVVLSATFSALFFAYFKCNIYLIIVLLIILGWTLLAKKWEFAFVILSVAIISVTSYVNYYTGSFEQGSYHTVSVEPSQAGKVRLLTFDGKRLRTMTQIQLDTEVTQKSKIYGMIENYTSQNGFSKITLHVITQKDTSPLLRSFLTKRVERISQGSSDLNGFLQAALLGDSQYLSKGFYQEMKDTNGLHLITISGMHVSMVLMVVIYFLSLLQLGYRTRYGIALGVLTLYILAVNFSVSVERAYIMGVIFLIAKLLFSEYDARKSLKIAYILSLLIAPRDLFSPSYQLSYVALFAIIYFYPYCLRLTKNGFLQFLLLSFIIQMCLQPIFLATFKQMNIFGFLNNILLVPFGTLIITLGFVTLAFSTFIYPIVYIANPVILWIFKSFQFYLGFLTRFGKFTFTFDTPYNGIILWIFFILILIFMWYNDERDYNEEREV